MKKINKMQYNDVLTEKDFYPPYDDRTIQPYIKEMYDGEFDEFAEYIYEVYESEDYWEN